MMHSSWWLGALLLVPLFGIALVLLVRRRPGASYVAGIGVATVEMVLSVIVAWMYNPNISRTGIDFATRHVLSAPLGLAYDVSLDGISLLMMLLTSLTLLLALIGARDKRREPALISWLLVLTTASMGSFLAHDLLLFFLFFELTLVPSYFLISQWGGAERIRAAMKFFVYTFVGSVPLLIGILFLGFKNQHYVRGALDFSYTTLSSVSLTHTASVVLFCAFGFAFAVKAPIWPFHSWSPITYAEAPTAGSIEMSALLAKLGSYGLVRFAIGLFPLALNDMRPIVLTLAVIGILYGSAMACVAADLKRVIAYSSVAQMGFIILGAISGSKIAMIGAVLLMFNHGVITIGFFLLVGFIEKRRQVNTIKDLRGLQSSAPVMAALFTVVLLASIGLPGLSGFISEYLILLGTFATHAWWAVFGALGVVGAALYWLWVYQRVFHGQADSKNREIEDVNSKERWVLVPVVALILVLGVFPRPAIDKISPSITNLIVHVSQAGASK